MILLLRGLIITVPLYPTMQINFFLHTGDECFYKNGADYRGTVNRTKSGVSCLYWSDIPALNKNIGHRYCRNPNEQQRPWCFVSSNGEFEYCNVPKCGTYLYYGECYTRSECCLLLS